MTIFKLLIMFLCLSLTGFGANRWELKAEYLWLYNNLDDSYFIVKSDANLATVDGARRKNNPTGFHSAFRVEAISYLCGFCDPSDIRVRWLYYDGKGHRKVQGDNLFGSDKSNQTGATNRFGGLVDSKVDVLHQNIELLFGKNVLECNRLNLALRAGLQYAYGRAIQIETYFNPNFVEEDRYRLRFTGGGPEIALEGRFFLGNFLCGDFYLNGLFSTSLLVSQSQAVYLQRNATTTLYNAKDDNNWRIVPATSLRFGLNYDLCICQRPVLFEIGYEVTSFIRALPKVIYRSPQPGLSWLIYSNFDLHGPYANVSVCF